LVAVISILALLSCLAVCGCAALSVTEATQSPAVGGVAPPDEKKLAELVGNAFKMAKLSGAAEVSRVHATHDNQIGDWMFCIKSSAPDRPLYAVLVSNNSISNVRSQVAIDGCDHDTYRPIAIANVPGGDDHAATPSPTPRRPRRGI
jgi:hypothetical protein